MDSNNMYQNSQTGGPEPGNDQNYGGNGYQENMNTNYGGNGYQENQNMNYGGNGYQESQNMNYGGNSYQENQNAAYGATDYQDNQSMNYSGSPYQNNNTYNQNPYQNPNYQPYPYNNNGYQTIPEGVEEPVSVGEWLLSMLVMLVPCVNIVMMFVWAFSKSAKKSKSNYFKAALIYFAIVMGLYIIAIIVVAVAGISLGQYY